MGKSVCILQNAFKKLSGKLKESSKWDNKLCSEGDLRIWYVCSIILVLHIRKQCLNLKQKIFIHTNNIYLCMKNLNIYTQLKYSILNTILFVQNYNLFKIRFPNIFSLLLVSSTIYLFTNSVRNYITTSLIRIISL